MTSHQPSFTEPDKTQPEAFQFLHRSDEADDNLVFDERCPKCQYDKGFTEGLEVAAKLVEDFGVAPVKAEAGGQLVNLAHRQPLAKIIRGSGRN